MDHRHEADIAHERATALQDRCDMLQGLADVLRIAASQLSSKAYDFEQAAFMQRRRSAELSGFWSKGVLVDEVTEAVAVDVWKADEFARKCQVVLDQIKPFHTPVSDRPNPDSTAETSISRSSALPYAAAFDPSFNDRTQHDLAPVGTPPSGQIFDAICTQPTACEGKPLESASQPLELARSQDKIRSHEQTRPNADSWPDIGLEAAQGLVQYTDRRDWRERRLIQRRARRLRRNLET